MIRKALLIAILVVSAAVAAAQPATPQAGGPQTRTATTFALSEYGVQIQPDARLIIVMAALDAAGFDPTPAGKEPSAFRKLLQKDLANLDPALRERLKNFYQL